MADNDWKKRLGVVFSTNPDFAYQEDCAEEEETLEPSRQNLIVSIDRKGRAGKEHKRQQSKRKRDPAQRHGI